MGVTTEQFLAACFKHIKGKPEIDWQGVATEVDMSLGGARDKYSFLMKQLEEERKTIATAEATPVAPKKRALDGAGADKESPVKKAARRGRTAKNSKVTPEDDASAKESESKEGGEDAEVAASDDEEAPAKKVARRGRSVKNAKAAIDGGALKAKEEGEEAQDDVAEDV